ncbi:hypothetical protein ACWCXX_06335 [Streptomyces sp. NPDC001732]
MPKPRPTVDEHTTFGRRLSGIHAELVHLSTELAHHYPQSGREAAPQRHIDKARQALLDACYGLENLAIDEHGDAITTKVHFPRSEHRHVVVPAPPEPAAAPEERTALNDA